MSDTGATLTPFTPTEGGTRMKMLIGAVLALLGQWFHTRLANLEDRMSLTETALADLNEATNEVADRLDELVADMGNVDAATAAAISEQTARLRSLAADPNDPVPAPENPTDAPV